MKISDSALKAAYCVIALFIAFTIILWFLGGSWFTEEQSDIASWIQAIMILIVLALASIFLLFLGRTYKVATVAGKAWVLLGIGMLCWLIGESIYVYIELVLLDDPFPTVADAFYLLGYLPLAIGLIIHARLIKLPLTAGSKVLVIIVGVLVGLFIAAAVIVYPIYISWPIPEEDVLVWLVGSMYPVLDIALVGGVLVVAVKLRKGAIDTAWVLLLAGLLVTVGADTLYNWVSNVGGEEMLFEYYDLLFIASYTLIFASTLKIINIIRKTF